MFKVMKRKKYKRETDEPYYQRSFNLLKDPYWQEIFYSYNLHKVYTSVLQRVVECENVIKENQTQRQIYIALRIYLEVGPKFSNRDLKKLRTAFDYFERKCKYRNFLISLLGQAEFWFDIYSLNHYTKIYALLREVLTMYMTAGILLKTLTYPISDLPGLAKEVNSTWSYHIPNSTKDRAYLLLDIIKRVLPELDFIDRFEKLVLMVSI